MRKYFGVLAFVIGLGFATGAKAQDVIDVDKFQPPIVATTPPAVHPHGWNVVGRTKAQGLKPFEAQVPAYNDKGKLIASWNPRENIGDVPTFIVVHGGHGVDITSIDLGARMIDRFGANVMILDSYWSRGRTDNWLAWTDFGANMRVLDAIAAARYAQSQGADPKKTFLVGGSQGGWTVLRMFTPHSLTLEVQQRFAGGAALYPNCYVKTSKWFGRAPSGSSDQSHAPALGNYVKPVLVFTGGEDTATPLSQCATDVVFANTEWTHYENATHGYDVPGRTCSKAPNVYNRFPVCPNPDAKADTYGKIIGFVQRIANVD